MAQSVSDRISLARRRLGPRLLRWYDANARVLPWRVGPGERRAGVRPDPYAVWLSEIMLQQTTVATVVPRFEDFMTRWPSVGALAAAPLDEVLGAWAGLGYYARARNLHRCARAVAGAHSGIFPDTEEALRALPGVGGYTAAAIAAIAFDRPAVVVDGNVERVVSRLFAIEAPLPASKPEVRERAGEIWPVDRPGDFAQGLMDLGAGVCRPRKPACAACPLSAGCAGRALGLAADLPRKAAKRPKPTRRGAAFILVNADGEVLFERREENGLLGGMLGVPGTAWSEEPPEAPENSAPERRRWRRVGEARHTFTHFHLRLDVFRAETRRAPREGERWLRPRDARLPTVMKKALAAGDLLDG